MKEMTTEGNREKINKIEKNEQGLIIAGTTAVNMSDS